MSTRTAKQHHAAVVDSIGRHLGDREFATTAAGYRALLVWIRGVGTLIAVGVEGTGAYGAELARVLTAAGLTVIEVDRPDRKARRQQGKSDPIDAYSAATAVAAGRASGLPKSRDGIVESIRCLRVARRSAVKARTQAINQIRALLITAPADLREQMRPLARNTVRAALAADTPPRYVRPPAGSRVDAFEPAIRALLAQFPQMPASVIAQRVGWTFSASVLRARVAVLRPLYAPADPADRTTYKAGEIVQCDLWFPGKVVPVSKDVLADPPVLTMVAAFSGFLMALLLPSRTTGDLLAGMWQLLSGLGSVPKILVWDNESGIGQHHRLTAGARSFAGTLGTRIYQTSARDPESKGVIERANGFFETSFMPGRSFTSPVDYNTQLAAWLPVANSRMLRRTGEQPGMRITEDLLGMGALPPVPPMVGTSTRVRLGRDYYVRIAGNDYSVDPTVIGRFVDVHAGLTAVTATCAGLPVADHQRCWTTRRTITDPAHVVTAGVLRTAFKERTAAMRGPVAAAGAIVGVRALSDYDELFDLATPSDDAAPRPDLRIVR